MEKEVGVPNLLFLLAVAGFFQFLDVCMYEFCLR